jgi:hypothetical protein
MFMLIGLIMVKGPVIVEQFARWAVLAWILTFRVVCKPLRKVSYKFLFPIICFDIDFGCISFVCFSTDVPRHDFSSDGW